MLQFATTPSLTGPPDCSQLQAYCASSPHGPLITLGLVVIGTLAALVFVSIREHQIGKSRGERVNVGMAPRFYLAWFMSALLVLAYYHYGLGATVAFFSTLLVVAIAAVSRLVKIVRGLV